MANNNQDNENQGNNNGGENYENKDVLDKASVTGRHQGVIAYALYIALSKVLYGCRGLVIKTDQQDP